MALSLLFSCNNPPANENKPTEEKQQQAETVKETQEVVKDGIFIHISSDDPHRILMGLMMANKMTEDKDVTVYFDIMGVYAILNDSPDITYKQFPSSNTLINELINKGITLQVCPGCLKAAEKTEADIMDGIVIADKDLFFNFTKGRILTLDY